ncbi:uncharacterized protein ACIQIH_011925 isoform 1-T1 [Cyanocitta cristata]
MTVLFTDCREPRCYQHANKTRSLPQSFTLLLENAQAKYQPIFLFWRRATNSRFPVCDDGGVCVGVGSQQKSCSVCGAQPRAVPQPGLCHPLNFWGRAAPRRGRSRRWSPSPRTRRGPGLILVPQGRPAVLPLPPPPPAAAAEGPDAPGLGGAGGERLLPGPRSRSRRKLAHPPARPRSQIISHSAEAAHRDLFPNQGSRTFVRKLNMAHQLKTSVSEQRAGVAQISKGAWIH